MRTVAALLVCVASVRAGDDLKSVLEPIRAKHDVPALGGAIVTGEKLLAIGVTGVRKKGAPDKVTVADKWHLGSCTKSMTATLIGRYVDRGDLTWDLTVKAGLPKLSGIDKKYATVTIDQLLRHRAGAPSDLHAGGLWGRLWQKRGTTIDQRRMLAEGVLKVEPVHAPGTAYLYSNAGYAIAGHILETREKKSWEELMRTMLFEPLGMKSAGFGSPGLDAPWGHSGVAVPVAPGPNADNPPAIGPAGTVHASLEDWGKYISLHLKGARDGEERLLLKRETLRRIQTPKKGETYAFGWIAVPRPWGGGRVLNHNGSNTMWYCAAWIAPLRNFGVITTCNQGGDVAAKACDEAAGALIRHYYAR
jgi:CubicO group peptidase (beta-lactamase class C family)